ncbi:MAG: hypothetical protein U9O98_06310, partial [Asgard group archaeon]|nr:hypothetical protein [Asgard group archaeon]
PNITITEIPDSITQSSSFTIKATIEDASELESVCLMYTIRGQVFQVNMTYNEEEDVWSATITITGNTGETVDLWIRATDIYYNTADSEIESFELQSEKSGLGHSNAWLWLIFLVLLIAPIVLTIVLLKPQK